MSDNLNNMTSTSNSDNQESGDTDSEEEVEPKLKYSRISNDLKNILEKDALSCIAVHSKFLCLGTHWGEIHLLDHQGNKIKTNSNSSVNNTNAITTNTTNSEQDTDFLLTFPTHVVSVNQISVDLRGEFVATCSDDGVATINGLYSSEQDQKLNLSLAIKSIALDPFHHKSGSGRRFIIGDRRLTLYEKTFLKGIKSTVLSETESIVSAIAWCDQFVAWASALGVRVYDLNERCSLGLIKWEVSDPEHTLTDFRCNLRWSNSTTLLIGWVDTIRVCVIRKRNSVEVSTRGLPAYVVDPISTFQTDFFVCGLAPLDTDQLVVLGYPKERNEENNTALRPVLCVMQFKTSDYEEICMNCLTLRGYELYKCNDYHLDCLIEDNQYFIMAPKDIVVASLYENDDRVKWLIEHRKFNEAMDVISLYNGRYSIVTVAKLYLDHLLTLKRYDDAAKLCFRVFGKDKVLWEEEVYKFVNCKQLRAVSAYLPRTDDCKLNPHVYEVVLFEYLNFDCPGFLNLIKEWPPTLYNTSAVINAIHDCINASNTNILLEALAILYSYEYKYEHALSMYLKLQHKDVFDLIKKHDLYSVIHGMIIPLMQMDKEKAIAMLLEKNKIPSEIVVQQLEQRQDYLYYYLDELDKVDSSGTFHWKLVNLYAENAPHKLLPFLKRSDKYQIQEALDICKRHRFYREMVYLLDRTGNHKDALSIIIHKIEDIQGAIDFCKEHDDMDLWNYLINESLDRSDVMTKLLDGVAGFINPVILVDKIKLGVNIVKLKQSLIKMLCDYSLQVSIQNGCNNILVTDYFELHEKLFKFQQKALHISNENTCGLCTRDILLKDSAKGSIIAFNCRHFFHEQCLPNSDLDFCTICKSKKP